MQPRVTDALTRALFIEWSRHGYRALSLEAVAKRAGVGKAALYRRWSSKQEMAVERLEAVGIGFARMPDTGSLEGDLFTVLCDLRRQLRHRLVRSILADLHAEMTRNSGLAEKVRGRLQVERRLRGALIFNRSIDRGEIPAAINLELLLDAVAALIYWRLVITGAHADDKYISELVRIILQIANKRQTQHS